MCRKTKLFCCTVNIKTNVFVDSRQAFKNIKIYIHQVKLNTLDL